MASTFNVSPSIATLAGRGNAGERWFLALLLGCLGFLLNGAPLTISPGVDVVLGGAFVFASYRLLSGPQFAVAFSLAAARSIMLWGHPWAWLIWTFEGVVLARMRRVSSPVIVDVCFWVFAGSTLLWLSYGFLLGMDNLSVQLTILKQGINGVLNVTLGEIIYISLGYALKTRFGFWPPRVSVGSLILPMTLVATTLPTILMMRVEAQSDESALFNNAALRLTDNLDESLKRLIEFHDSAETALAEFAGVPNSASSRPLRSGLGQHVFAEVRVLDSQEAFALTGFRASDNRLTLISHRGAGGAVATPALVMQAENNRLVLARLRPAAVRALIEPAKINAAESIVMLVDPNGRIAVASGDSLPDRVMLDQILKAPAGGLLELQPATRFGTSLMNRISEATYMKSTHLSQFPGWRLVTSSTVKEEILQQRQALVRVLSALALVIIGMSLLSRYVARLVTGRLQNVSATVSQFAVRGADPEAIARVMVAELAEILTSIARTGELLKQERDFLLVNRRRLESIARYAPVVIFSFERPGSLDGVYTYISENAERLFGYTVAEMLEPGWWHSNLHPEDYRAEVDNLLPGVAMTKEYRLRHKQGHYIWVYECLAISDDHPDEVVGVLIDISDRKRIAEQLSFSSKMESLGRIAAGIAHELNQPLQIVRLATQNMEYRLQHASPDLAGALEKLEIVKGQIDRAAKIVRQVNAFGKPTSSIIRPVKLAEIFDNTFALLRMQIEENVAELDCGPIDPSLTVLADPLRLEQVIINLVQNARNSIAKKGNACEPGRITRLVQKAGEGVLISIEDNGTGISPEDLPFVFEPFFTTRSSEGGTGLGLSVSYSIINEMGGRIWAENLKDGARFSIWLKQGPD